MKLLLAIGLMFSVSAYAVGTGGAGNAGTSGSGSPSSGTIGENSGMGSTSPGSGNATVTNGANVNGAQTGAMVAKKKPASANNAVTDCSKTSGKAYDNCVKAGKVK